MTESTNTERAKRILDAANRLFVRYGFDKTTVGEIADEARVSKGAIYLHWKSKEDLFEALIFREGERVVEDMIARIEADPEAGTVFSLFQYGILVVLDNPLLHALMTRDMRVVGDFVERWQKSGLVDDSNLFREQFVTQLQAAHVIRADLDGKVLSYILTLIRYGFFTVHQVVPEAQTPPLGEVGKMLAEILERGLAPEDGADKAAGKRALENVLESLKTMLHKYHPESTG